MNRIADRIGVTAWIAVTSVLFASPALARPDFSGSGLGTLRVGMPADRAAARGWVERDPSPCNSGWRTARYAKQLQVRIWHGKVMAVSTTSRRFATRKAVRPGDALQQLKSKYAVKHVGRNLYSSDPILHVPGTHMYFTVRDNRVASVHLTKGFLPDGSELEC